MPILDWNRTFVQADILSLVPKLKVKNLQNWKERGLLDWDDNHALAPSPGRGGRRPYKAADLVTLAFMVELVDLGISPAEAAKMAWSARQSAYAFVSDLSKLSAKARSEMLSLSDESMQKMGYAIVRRSGVGGFYVSWVTPDQLGNVKRNVAAFIVVETDALLVQIINRLARQDSAEVTR